MLTFIVGGAASGKSAFAQSTASLFPDCHFYGTAVRFDGDEVLQEKILELKRARPAHIRTFEPPLQVEEFLSRSTIASCVVIDCVSLWVGTLLTEKFAQYSRSQIEKHCLHECAHFISLVKNFENKKRNVFVVSTETGAGIQPSHESGRIYRQVLGKVNQLLAANSDFVCNLVSGIPLLIKEPIGTSSIETVSSQKLFEKLSHR